MRRTEIEELLWELARLEDEGRGIGDAETVPEVPDAVLEAYRAGALSEKETDRVERFLIRSTAGRERLAELAGVSPPTMSDAARRRLLRHKALRHRALRHRALGHRALGTQVRPAEVQPDRRRPASLSPSWLLAAAAAVVVVVVGAAWFLLVPGTPEELPPLPEIEASIQGLAGVRGQALAGSDSTTAEADTAVTVGVVVHPPRAGLEVGLYVFRPDRGAVVRLPLQAVWTDRRTAVFRAAARQLVGESPGTYTLFAVIGRADGLPPDRILRSGERPETAFAGHDVKVEPLHLEIVVGAALESGRGSPDRRGMEP